VTKSEKTSLSSTGDLAYQAWCEEEKIGFCLVMATKEYKDSIKLGSIPGRQTKNNNKGNCMLDADEIEQAERLLAFALAAAAGTNPATYNAIDALVRVLEILIQKQAGA
jgi:hypothetical protein